MPSFIRDFNRMIRLMMKGLFSFCAFSFVIGTKERKNQREWFSVPHPMFPVFPVIIPSPRPRLFQTLLEPCSIPWDKTAYTPGRVIPFTPDSFLCARYNGMNDAAKHVMPRYEEEETRWLRDLPAKGENRKVAHQGLSPLVPEVFHLEETVPVGRAWNRREMLIKQLLMAQ